MAQLTLSFLGPFQATLGEQPITHFRSTNNQGLLVYLALKCERPQPRELLAALLWPEESDKNAHNNLRQALFQLRKLLGDLDNPVQPFLLVTRQTVQFNSDSNHNLDVGRFLQAIDDNELETAVSLYHGDLLPGFTCDSPEFEDWLRQEREQLHRLALEAMYEVTQAHLQNGRYPQAKTVAQQQLHLEPWREPAHRQLMQAFALSGDRNNALLQYETCRELLMDELGVEPAPETTTLYEEIQAGRYSPITSTEPLRPPVKVKHNLPVDATPFIGRELELNQVHRLLTQDNRRMVSIIGAGGMGKTRLAVAAGSELLEQYPDGVYFVDLAPLSEHDAIIPAIAATLEYQAPDKNQAVWPQLLASLSRRHLLLILDNFEHLLEGATLINDILQRCRHVSILVTSRQRLNLASESRYELGGLDFPDSLTPEDAMGYTAVQLFVDYGRRVRPNFDLTSGNMVDVIRICQLVQGMPLGLVLAAAWLEMLTTAEIVAEVEDCLYFLAADLADLPPRQRSVRAVFDRSWQMMEPEEQQVMAKLSVFRGGFTREAAEQVAGANLRLLLSLVNKSMLRRQPESGRFLIHELLRQFAGIKLHQNKDYKEAHLAHCRYFTGLLDNETYLSVNMYPMHLPRKHLADRDNIIRAWNYAQKNGLAEELGKMARGMAVISFARGIPPVSMLAEAIQTMRQHGAQDSDLAMIHLRLVELNTRMEYDGADLIRPRMLKFLHQLEEQSDLEILYWAYDCMAFLDLEIDDEQALTWHEKSYDVALRMENERLTNRTLGLTLWFLVDSGFQDDRGLTHLEAFKGKSRLRLLQTLLDYFEAEFPHSFIVYGLLMALSIHNLTLNAYEKAIYYGKRGLNIGKDWHDLYWIGFAGERLADIYLEMDLPNKAKPHLLDILEWHLALGQVWQTLGSLWSMTNKYGQLLGGKEIAVSILSMVYHHPEATQFYRQEIEKALLQYGPEERDESYAAAWEKGKAMDLETAVAQVYDALTDQSNINTNAEMSPRKIAGPQ